MEFKDASAAICGLGGLGSNIAVMLARSGIGRLKIMDFDRVEQSNLNRQSYCQRHIGSFKAEVLKEQLNEINPAVNVTAVTVKITRENACELLANCDIICEAFDNAESKAMLCETVLMAFPEKKLVCGSGMAGLGSANKIITRQAAKNLYICGDGEADSSGFYAPRVMICAGHQANMVLRLIKGIEDV